MKHIVIFILLAAGFIATQITQPPLQTHILIKGSPCHWDPFCGYDPLSPAAWAGRAGILIGMVLATVLLIQLALKRFVTRGET